MTASTPGHLLAIDVVKVGGRIRKVGNCSCGWKSKPRENSELVRKDAAKNHREAVCPNPTKVPYPDRRSAELSMLRFWRTGRNLIKQPVRAYECHCGFWHTTSVPVRESCPSDL